MTTQSRRDTIVEMVRLGEVSVADLARTFEVTESTIRRDLARLAGEQRIVRTFSGATGRPEPEAEAPTSVRAQTARQAKHRIATHARTMIPASAWVYLDAGTTCAGLAQRLVDAEDVTVVTPSLLVVRALAKAPRVTVLATGGRLRPISEAFVGREAERLLQHVSIDTAFFSADAVHPARGILEVDTDQIALKEAVVRAARRVVVLADASKIIDHVPAGYWLPWPRECEIVVDAAAAQHQLDALRATGPTVTLLT